MCVCVHVPGARPGTVCDFRGCDASVRRHYIKRDVGWRNEVKDFRCAEPDLFFLGGGGMTNFAAVPSLRYNPDLLALIFLCLCRSVSEMRLQKFFYSSSLNNVEALTSARGEAVGGEGGPEPSSWIRSIS